ncbi:MMPL family transporter [Mycolicibacterium mucogenicum]|uniref:MMPL family transporter n=1 Tax=Mycolicibacterium mucogenicum TaxID=56689 RepID=UPI002269F6BA|nr:MMPL family transporter [Mycolicibacterium mucogenicum]MCX8563196.1 MMPL family transporter [Mycolicibacterium mucogenicum]
MGHNSRFFAATSSFCAKWAWVVIGFWVALAGILNVAIPQLEQTVAERSAPFMPANIKAAQTLREMSDAFGVPRSSAVGSVVLVDERGINAADEALYRDIVATLQRDKSNVAYVLDTYDNPQLRDIALSPDHKAINLVLAGTGDVGSTKAHKNTIEIRDQLKALPKPPGVGVYLTGPSPTLADLFSAMDFSLLIITAVSVLLITLVLLMVYRSLPTAMVPLLTIGIALGVARPIVSLLGMTGALTVSNFTISLMTAMLLGAATDYAIFILAGYHEARRSQVPVADAIAQAGQRVSGILIASMLTIAAAATAMGFTELGMFKAAGPPIAIAIVVGLAVSMSLPYALLSLLGKRGLAEPRPLNDRRWRRIGSTMIRRSGVLVTASLVLLLSAASVLTTFRVNFDENAMQLDDTESAIGYQKTYAHWGVNEAAPEYLIVSADHDMRNTDDLAVLDRVAGRLSGMPEIAYVRSMTRPAGKQLPQTTIGYQAGIVADRLGDAKNQVNKAVPDIHRLDSGAAQLRDGAASAVTQIPQLVSGIKQVTGLAHQVLDGYQAAGAGLSTLTDGTVDVRSALADLSSSTGLLDAALQAIDGNAQVADAGRLVSSALGSALDPQPGPECLMNPVCSRARADIADLDTISNGAVSRALLQAQRLSAVPQVTVEKVRAAEPAIRNALATLQKMVSNLPGGSPAQARTQLTDLVRGADQLSAGMTRLAVGLDQVKGGVDQVVNMSGRLTDGLGQATDYLATLSTHTGDGPASGFYLPPQGFSDPAFRAAQDLLFSPDGKTARMLVIWKINPYSAQALDASRALAPAATEAASGTSLQTARFASTGLASLSADMRDQVWHDFAVYGIVAILGVLLVLIALLRSILAPVFMVAVVTLSFTAAAGVSVLVWQHLIGVDVDWSVFPVSFMALIAVGADYSMLFAARIRDESGDGMIRGIMRSFGSTGSVITTAGIVFALTMFALMTGRVINLLQIGFTIGVGLLIDITLVRTVLVPAAMAMIGNRIWWPSKPHAERHSAMTNSEREPVTVDG